MSKDVLWRDGREPNKVVEPPDRCYLGGVTYISLDRILEIIDDIEQDRLVYSRMNEFEVLDEVKIRIAALKGGDVEVRE